MMFNARTWHRLCISAYLLFPALLAGWFLPHDSVLRIPVAIAILWAILISLLGACQGVLFALGRLRMGCPECGAASDVLAGGMEGMVLDCPKCGELWIRLGRLGRLDGKSPFEANEPPSVSGNPLLVPMRHPVAFAVVFAPVVGSVIAASLIHRFGFFYLIIPGFWCYAVAGFVLDALFSGTCGKHTRFGAPTRYWGNLVLWSLFYVFAASFPIGYAMQESAKEKGGKPTGGEISR